MEDSEPWATAVVLISSSFKVTPRAMWSSAAALLPCGSLAKWDHGISLLGLLSGFEELPQAQRLQEVPGP